MEGGEEESQLQRRRAAAQQRLDAHIAWKRGFFQARPPPEAIGRLHRRQQGVTKGRDCHSAFHTALRLAAQSDLAPPAAMHGDEAETVTQPLPPALTSSPVAESLPRAPSRQEAWAAQLLREKERRNPATDLNVRSDPTRTVVMANLHPDTVEEDVRHFADQFGRVLSVRIVRHHKTGKSRRYAFVEFNLVGEARKAQQFHRRKRLKGHAIIIDRERGRTESGFLPKRLATASAFWDGAAADQGATAAATDATAATPKAAPAPAMPDNDDDFLNAILNG